MHSGWHYIDPTTANMIGPFASREIAEEMERTHNRRIAFDRSARTYDVDNRLHVATTNISKANVCPYYGREIPDFEQLGLDPDRKYMLLRDPEELRKAAPTFNNLQLLAEHVPVSADDHQPDLVIGSTGTDAEFDGTYLKNSLVVWATAAIDAIENDEQKELSSAYRYRADMTPGEYQGEAYDGVMRDIVGNHVALVKEGRAGPDVVVGDSKENAMSKVLTRKATLLKGVAIAALMPKLAADAKVNIAPLFVGVNAKNAKSKLPGIFDGIKTATKGKLAKDATLDDVLPLLEKMEVVDEPEGIDIDPSSGMPMIEMPEATDSDPAALIAKIKELLGDTLSAEDSAALDAMCSKDEFPPKGKNEKEEKEPMVSKKAMDAAIAAVEKRATAKGAEAALKTAGAIRDAEKTVRPYVGELALAHDSAEGVFRTALTAMDVKVEGLDELPLPALKAILAAQPIPGVKKTVPNTVAQDGKTASDFASRFPGADRIRSI